MVIIIHALASCRCVEVVSGSEVQKVQMFKSVDTILVHDSIYLHDSVIYRERTIHDTVYITKEVYRDANHSTLQAQHSTKTDTIRETEYVTEIIEKPPERYIPKFHKWCTGLFLTLIAGVILYYVLKIVIRYYLRK